MIAIICFCLALSSLPFAPRPGPTADMQRVRPRTIEEFHRHNLESLQRSIAILEDWMAWLPKIDDSPESRQKLQQYRKVLQNWKAIERELVLWEKERKAWPGPETDLRALERLKEIVEEGNEKQPLPLPHPRAR
jgi:hypothetical protein